MTDSTSITVDESELRELLELMLAHYTTKGRNAQAITTAEVLRYLDGIGDMLTDLREIGYVPVTLHDIPQELGGR